MANEVKTPIPARLYNVAVGGHVAGADDIIDDKTGMVVSELVGNKPATSEENPFNGMGVVILPMNIQEVEEDDTTVQKNILTQEMMSATNTKYVVKYDYILGENITVPANCVLEFDGGSIKGNGTITGNNTRIVANITTIFPIPQSERDAFDLYKLNNPVYDNTVINYSFNLAGTWVVYKAYPEWFGAVGDGVTDDTMPIQKTLNNFHNIYFPKSNYALTQVFIRSNTIITFSENCLIKAARELRDHTTEEAERMLDIRTVDNVTIYGNHATVDMRRNEIGSLGYGEYRHCVTINGSHNVTIYDLNVKNCFGDGIAVGYPTSRNNMNINIIRCTSDNATCCAASIVDGDGVIFDSCVFSNTKDAPNGPFAGMDIEPNSMDGYIIRNIKLVNCKSINNLGAGLLIAMSLKTTQNSNNHQVDVTVDNWVSENDLVGFSLQNGNINISPYLYGSITINNPVVHGIKFAQIGIWTIENLYTVITNATFVKTRNANNDTPRENSVILIRTTNGSVLPAPISNIAIDGIIARNKTQEKINKFLNHDYNHTLAEGVTTTLKNFSVKNIDILQNEFQVNSEYGMIYGEKRENKNVLYSFNAPNMVKPLSIYSTIEDGSFKITDGGTCKLASASSYEDGTKVRFYFGDGIIANTVFLTGVSGEQIYNASDTLVDSITVDAKTYYNPTKLDEWIEFQIRHGVWCVSAMSDRIKTSVS